MVHSSDLCKEMSALQGTSFLFFCLLHLITGDFFFFLSVLCLNHLNVCEGVLLLGSFLTFDFCLECAPSLLDAGLRPAVLTFNEGFYFFVSCFFFLHHSIVV